MFVYTFVCLFVCVAGQMCVALDSIRTVALGGKRSLEETSALFVSV